MLKRMSFLIFSVKFVLFIGIKVGVILYFLVIWKLFKVLVIVVYNGVV